MISFLYVVTLFHCCIITNDEVSNKMFICCILNLLLNPFKNTVHFTTMFLFLLYVCGLTQTRTHTQTMNALLPVGEFCTSGGKCTTIPCGAFTYLGRITQTIRIQLERSVSLSGSPSLTASYFSLPLSFSLSHFPLFSIESSCYKNRNRNVNLFFKSILWTTN